MSIDLVRKGLRNKGHNVYIFAPEYYDYEDADDCVFRFRSMEISGKARYPIAIPFSFKYSRLLNSLDLHIVHSHHPFAMGTAAYYWAKKLSVPLVYTYHTQYEQYLHYAPVPENISRIFLKTGIGSFINKADLVLAPSESIIGQILSYNSSKRIEVVPNAVNVSLFRNVSPERAESVRKTLAPDGNPVLIYTGRIAKEKNLEMMLKAFRLLLEKSGNIKPKLLIVGDGPELEKLKRDAFEMSIAEDVVFTGAVNHGDIPVYLNAADVFLMTSTTEVKPVSLLEALAAGLPVIAVDACGTRDTITHGYDGLLTGNNIHAFTNILLHILNNEELRISLGRNALATADKYSVENITELLLEKYRMLLGRQEVLH